MPRRWRFPVLFLCLTLAPFVSACPWARVRHHGVYGFEDIKSLYRDYHVKPAEADIAFIRYGVYPSGPIQIYDVRSPQYREALELAGYDRKQIETDICGVAGLCYSRLHVWGTTQGERRSIIGIKPQQTEAEIAYVIAEELAHARFAKEPRWHEDHNALLIGNQKTFVLVDEFQAKTRASQEIKGAARTPVEILRELHTNYTDLKEGQTDFEVLLYLTEKFGQVPLENMDSDKLVEVAYRIPGGIEPILDREDKVALALFRQKLHKLME